ncbi:MAG: hypothetical protein K1X83_03950 [Oligoflexia bacterium]|nr:hypothetical protein [Oligoflexia bacterium]
MSKKAKTNDGAGGASKYPRHTLEKVLRIPRAIVEQNAGKPCTEKEAASFVGVGLNGPFRVEISSASKYGLLDRPEQGKIGVTELAKKIIRPQKPQEELSGLRGAVLNAPEISTVYQHYRGENLPDPQFFNNALTDKFKIPA